MTSQHLIALSLLLAIQTACSSGSGGGSGSAPQGGTDGGVDAAADGTDSTDGTDGANGDDTAAGDPITVTARQPVVVKNGDTVTFTGTNFKDGLKVAGLGGEPQAATVVSATKATIKADGATVSFGQVKLTLTQGESSTQVDVVFVADKLDYPFITEAPAEVCAGKEYYDADGVKQTGTKDCDGDVAVAPEVCDADGETDCLVSGDFKAADTGAFADSDVRDGVTVAGIAGTLTGAPAGCSSDGELGCLSNSSYRAAATASLADKVLTTATVASVTGNVTLPAANKVLTGNSYGVGGTGMSGSLTLPTVANVRVGNGNYGIGGNSSIPTLANCSAEGAVDCVTTATYRPALTTGLGDKVLSTAAVAGINGNVTLPLENRVLTGTAFGVAGTGPNGTLTLPLANKVRANAGNFGIGGNGSTATLADCSANNDWDCVATSSYRSFSTSNMNAANIRSGVTVAGIVGDYPSASNPLDGATGTDDLINFATQVTTSGSFEFWDSTGTRRTGSGDADIVDTNVKTGVAFENLSINGSYVPTLAGSDAKHIRAGASLGGITGTLKTNCRDYIRSAFYNQDGLPNNSGGVGGSTLDYWDATDDYAGGTRPTAKVTGWSNDYYCDGTQITDGTSNLGMSSVNAATHGGDYTWNKVYLEPYSGLYFTNVIAVSTWSEGIALCDNLNNGNQAGGTVGSSWRMPSLKELNQLIINGLDRFNFGGVIGAVWAASTNGFNAFEGNAMSMASGYPASYAKSFDGIDVMCVR